MSKVLIQHVVADDWRGRVGCQPSLPEVLRAEGSVQVRVHVSGALLHRPRVGDEGHGFEPFPLDLSTVFDPQVDQRHA